MRVPPWSRVGGRGGTVGSEGGGGRGGIAVSRLVIDCISAEDRAGARRPWKLHDEAVAAKLLSVGGSSDVM